MTLPVVLPNYFQERAGVIQVALRLNELNLIFRETPNADVGIDGQIEHVTANGEASGKILAVQIKSGISYFNDKGDAWGYYASDKHKEYWQSYPIPMFLFLHHPKDSLIYFTDVRHFLSTPENLSSSFIPVAKTNILNAETKKYLFQSYGLEDQYSTDLVEVLKIMVNTKNLNNSFPLSFFDLFAYGLTNLCRHLYFSISVAMDIAEENMAFEDQSEFGMGLGGDDHDYLHEFVKFLLAQNLAKVDYADYLIDWKERLLQPSFLSPLTIRGQKLLTLIREYEKELLGKNINVSSIVSERSIDVMKLPSDYLRDRRIYDFQKKFIEKQKL